MSQPLHARVPQLVTDYSISPDLSSRLHRRIIRGILRLYMMTMINSGVRQVITENE